jgi:hypothetical protein
LQRLLPLLPALLPVLLLLGQAGHRLAGLDS